MNEIISWKPFKAAYIGYDGVPKYVRFKCPHCGSGACDRRTKRVKNRIDDRHFWQGEFRCSKCGAESDATGEPFYYASDCFIKTRNEIVEQLSLF